MEPEKTRKRLVFIAIIATFAGVFGLVASVWYAFILESSSEKFAKLGVDEHAQAAISGLLTSLKILSVVVIPGFSVIALAVGLSILALLRKAHETR